MSYATALTALTARDATTAQRLPDTGPGCGGGGGPFPFDEGDGSGGVIHIRFPKSVVLIDDGS